ncbi:WD repeat-containing protein 81 isoform X2 [Osmia bicornis bicornis]|uniref:WD repeat-containing protein 81 isoform X2 n=1 Tax=Osmia bicornis bicornis TaxID=1437191 RepID=UPI001EAF2549|nr:WD repeat-containing protein 81 isoform X2 [Osmia bicornis bicornis]
MDTIKKDLLVPTKYIKVIDGRICLTVHRNWLANLHTMGPISFINHERLREDEVAAHPMLDELGPDWMRIYIRVYKKQHKYAVPLPRGRHANGNTQADLTFSQLMHYVAETNYRNLWKECYKKYYSPWNCIEQRDQCNITANVSDTSIMQEVLQKMYGCALIQIQNGSVVSISPGVSNQVHCNLLPVLCAIETASAFLTLHEQTAEYSVRECVMYSPAALSTSHGKPLFLIYQLLQLSRDLHDRGLVLGEITLSDILLMDNFTIQVLPKLSDNIYLKPEPEPPKVSAAQEMKGKSFNGHKRNFDISTVMSRGNPEFGMNENIEKLCEMWVYNCISNYDYLTALNNMAGRRYGDPSCHHVMPWVTDFTSRCGGNWRDLTKSKFRLNKGDRQLDLTFDAQSTEVGHHVSDVLSEITYYVYLSRRYDKSVLCKYVRPQWVPGEYPASIQRLHDWSPDECIPQFFIDPSVFKSIHEDLPDLEIPSWATSPEDFIERHREALESFHVSERLHHWIDLTFGYKLSGSAAVKSKNVCLQLVDNHTSLTNTGIVQLFTQPHPQKIIPSPYWCKIPPRLRSSFIINKYKNDQSGNRTSDDEGHSSGFEEEELPASILSTSRSSPLVLSRLLSRSRGSLLSTEDNVKQDKSTNQTIILPKDYNPVTAIMQVETMHTFMNKVSSQVYKPEIEVHESSTNYKQIVASGRIKEQQILGCLIVEIFLSNKFRATWNVEKMSFAKRLTTCLNTLKLSADSLPKCVRNAVALLLQVDIIPRSYNVDNIEVTDTPFRYPTVTYMGLPPPSAHQFLQPILSGSLFPFSKYYKHLFNIVEMLQEYNSLVRELNFIMKSEEDMDVILKTKTKFLCKISECKVKAIAIELEHLLSHTGIAREACLELIVPHIQQIMEESYSAVLAAWYLFDPIAKALGPKDTAQTFLLSIMRLYENGSFMDNSPYADIFPSGLVAKFKTTRLYHRNFLLKLMVRLGLRRFLENFITPLVEAVGGYRDYIQGSLTYTHKSGNLKTCDLSGISNEGEGILSPLDEDFSADSEHNIPLSPGPVNNDCMRDINTNDNDVEVFTMETEENSSVSVNSGVSYDIDSHVDLNLNLNDDLNEEGNKISPVKSVKSPTIPIPKASNSLNKSITEFNNISCNVGSKTSNDEFTYSGLTHSDNNFEEISTVGLEEQNPTIIQTDDIKSNAAIHEDIHIDNIYQKSTSNECTTSEMSAESIIWLSHRLGPVLTARYLSRNLLRMLTLCYTGKENLTIISDTLITMEGISWNKKVLIGDHNAAKVLECLAAIAGLYGEQIIVLQYFAHMVELLALCKRKLTQNLEGGLISCLTLLNHITPYLSDAVLMDVLHESIVKAILYPTVRILSSTRFTFPNGVEARNVMAEKCLETLFMFSLRLGSVITRNHLAVPIQRFFLAFDKSFNQNGAGNYKNEIGQKTISEHLTRIKISSEDNKDVLGVQSNFNADVADSYSPPATENMDVSDHQKNKALEELRAVFTAEFAHKTYMLFYKCIDSEIMEQILKNHEHIHNLCRKYEQEARIACSNSDNASYNSNYNMTENAELVNKDALNFENISVVGNRFSVQKNNIGDRVVSEGASEANYSSSIGRQLRGNWLAYWEHEIGRSEKDTAFNIKQIKLQTFSGHTNSVKCLSVLDNENSFMSGGRDKTVKLWSLRSQGDGNTVSSCQYTYTGHKKSILALTFLESLRYVVTCDGTIHCWDPFMGSLLGCPESSRPVPVNTLVASPSPCTTLLAGTTDITLRVIDCRTFQYVNEMKVSVNPTGLIRCIAVAPSGYWVALGQASGFLTILDIRTGLIIASWKGHECEILQLEAINETTIISSSLDETIAVWSALDGKLKFHMKGSTEPVHCMATYEQELIIGTTANRVGVYSSIETTTSFSSSKLKSDTFKGLLTTMAVLPLNRLLLLGADNGGITLIC